MNEFNESIATQDFSERVRYICLGPVTIDCEENVVYIKPETSIVFAEVPRAATRGAAE